MCVSGGTHLSLLHPHQQHLALELSIQGLQQEQVSGTASFTYRGHQGQAFGPTCVKMSMAACPNQSPTGMSTAVQLDCLLVFADTSQLTMPSSGKWLTLLKETPWKAACSLIEYSSLPLPSAYSRIQPDSCMHTHEAIPHTRPVTVLSRQTDRGTLLPGLSGTAFQSLRQPREPNNSDSACLGLRSLSCALWSDLSSVLRTLAVSSPWSLEEVMRFDSSVVNPGYLHDRSSQSFTTPSSSAVDSHLPS